ncbi:MAG TPA: DegT/DnrJ/EryC1/StrS family aminotransferase, partial [Planctomycetaceae bacterium]|nr:DegT/DnrJ/EryC1/StrS family aminotransferase [Planctomycetaceae bacterium]
MTNTTLDFLALDGGVPVRQKPLAPWPVFDEAQCDAVQNVLKTGKVNYWTGQECRQFEKEFADAVDCSHAVAVANGTLAIELALHALGVGPGDDVIVPPRTFIATASAVWARGARPIFADVDPFSGNVSAATIEAALTPKTKAIIPVHIAGWPCEMDSIMDLAHDRRLLVIEDCAQAHGATYKGQPLGSIGHIGAFSFCQDKILTTGGEGGMLTTNRKDLWR